MYRDNMHLDIEVGQLQLHPLGHGLQFIIGIARCLVGWFIQQVQWRQRISRHILEQALLFLLDHAFAHVFIGHQNLRFNLGCQPSLALDLICLTHLVTLGTRTPASEPIAHTGDALSNPFQQVQGNTAGHVHDMEP